MTEREVLLGTVLGGEQPRLAPLPRHGPTPLRRLEEVFVEALSTPPCVLTFSGGRDSSALLAIGLEVARRHGLAEPIPFTLRYPGVVEADESDWQELVIAHLGPKQWERVELPATSADLLGAVGSASLAANGLLWPPAIHLVTGWLHHVAGATVLTGEGGDEILGPYRATALRVALRRLRGGRWALPPDLLRHLLVSSAPVAVRARINRRQLAKTVYLSWLRGPLREAALREAVSVDARQPWSWSTAIRSHPQMRRVIVGEANRDWLGAKYDVRFVHPFLDAGFIDAVARDGGPLGYAGRTDAMRKLFGDRLPDAVLARSSKATFNSAFGGPETVEFARSWDGGGVDSGAVDVEVLRSLWLESGLPAGTMALLQSAWLASQPVPLPPPTR